MHVTKIVMKDGKVYESVVIDYHITLLERKDKQYVRLFGDKIREICLFDIESAGTEKGRVGLGRIEDVNALPFWVAFYNENKSLKRV